MRGDDWFVTPREFEALQARRAEQKRENFLDGAGFLAAVIENNNAWVERERVVQPRDYLVDGYDPEEVAKAERVKMSTGFLMAQARADAKRKKKEQRAAK